ncbi:hypothetical protein [Streptomyces malaysiensis]|nr:hypothetical protein [Streptomyces sp. M56]
MSRRGVGAAGLCAYAAGGGAPTAAGLCAELAVQGARMDVANGT